MTGPARNGVIVYASDVVSLAEFYVELFGMSRLRETEEFISLDSSGFNLIIHSPPIELAATRFNTVKLFLTVDSLDETRDRVQALGGESLQGEWANPLFKVCNIADPDGNHIQIREFLDIN